MNTLLLDHKGHIYFKRSPIENWHLYYLSYKIQLDEAYTFRSLFQMLEYYPNLSKLSPFLDAFLGAFRKCPETGCVNNRCDFIEFGKTVEMIGFPGKPRLEIYSQMVGRRKRDPKKMVPLRDFEMDELLDMQIRLGKLRHIIFGDTLDTFEYDTLYTLFEFIEGVAWELSFQGASKHCQWGD